MVALMISVAAFVFAQGPDQEISRRRERADGIRRRQQEFYRQRAYPSDRIPPGARATAVAEMEHMIAAERKLRGTMITGPAWTLIGPRPTNTLAEYGPGGAGLPYAAGRVAALAVDPRDANVAYLGAAGGGVWKTTDGGQNWQPLTDDQPSLASGSIAIAPSDPDTVYVGTGEDNNSGDSYYGAGVLKSTDGGATWTQLAGPFVGPFSSSRTSGGGARIAALAVHPTDPNTVLAAVDRFPAAASGIYRTSDGGQTWTLVQGGAVGTEVIFNPTDPTIAYAALGTSSGNSLNGVYKSTDSGMTWKASGGRNPTALPTASVGRIEIALAPSNPNILYAGIQNSGTLFGTLLGMFKSTDAGQTWTQVFAPDYCTPQCSYNNVIRIHPKNPNVVVAAGLPPWRSTNGGLTWSNIAVGPSGFAAHTDHHALAFSNDGRLYDGNDGGAFSTSDVTAVSPTWANLNATLAITEFSSNVSIHPSDPNIAYAGTQDNSTQMYTGNLAWDQVTPGDGGRTAIDPAIPSIWYASFNGITPLKFNGLTSVSSYLFYIFTDSYPYLRNGIATTDRSQFYPPMVMDPSNPLRLYYGTQRLYQSSDGAGTWTAISPDLTASNTGTITAIAVSPSFPGAVAVGTNTGKVQVTNTGLQSGSVEWIDRSTGLPGRSVAQVAFDPTTVTTVYAILSGFSGFLPNDSAGHVFKSTDFGETWNDISGNLPNIPVNDIVVDPDQPNVLCIATDIGVFLSSDGGMTWSTLSNGLPRVLVQGLNLHRPSRTLRAVTYGRSMWDLSVPLAGSSSAPQIRALSPANVNANTNPMTIALTGSNFTLTSVVRWNGSDQPTSYGSASTLHVTLPASDLGQSGRATILVFNPVTGGGLSNSVNVPVGPAPSATAGGLTSAANPALVGTLVPGGIHSIFGSGLAPATVSAGTPPLPNTLGGITVEINTIPAPLFYVSPTQINFQAPWDLEGHSSATLTVINGTLKSAPLPVNVAAAAPSLFSIDASGRGQGAILIAGPEVLAAPDGKFSSSRPARHGEFIEIYCTGLGPVSRIQASGTPKPPTTPPAITQTPVVTVGGVPAVVTFSGLAPGGVGLYQVNVQVPDGTPAGDAVPVIVTIGGASSNTVTLAVSP
jgi:uncharacterized protein (TIGR03437 family)